MAIPAMSVYDVGATTYLTTIWQQNQSFLIIQFEF